MTNTMALPTTYPVDPRLDYVEILRDGIVRIFELLRGCPHADDLRGHTPGETGIFIRQIDQKVLDPTDPQVTEAMLTEHHTVIVSGPIQDEEAAQSALEEIRSQNEGFIVG